MTRNSQFWKTAQWLALFFLGGEALFCFWSYKNSQQTAPLIQQTDPPPYFVSLPIVKFSMHTPCLSVKLGEQSLIAELDLGFKGYASIATEFLEPISEKRFIDTYHMYGLRGKKYEKKIYSIPSFQIGNLSFSPLEVHEENPEFLEDSFIIKEDASSSHEACRLGWKLFTCTNVLLDLSHSIIAFCDGVESLTKQGYSIENFTKTPLLLDRGLLEFEVKTPRGMLRCFLDSGCGWNVLHTDLQDGESFNTRLLNPENMVEFPSFLIGDRDFGPLVFHTFPILLPVSFEAILGSEFLFSHIVFLNFSEGTIYFSPSTH